MHERHTNRAQYFEEQIYTTEKYVIPFINGCKKISPETSVLEIGCGEGGNLKPFMDLGCKITGIDLSERKIELAVDFFKEHKNYKNLTLICDDIYNRKNLGKFDIIILRDVIEHIPGQDRFMDYMKSYLNSDSVIYFGFPPWQNPFGGHQQLCNSRFLSKLPYFHLFPKSVYKAILNLFKEPQVKIKGFIEVKETSISIERFEKILKKNHYKIARRVLYLFNPNYEAKFKLKPRKQNRIIASIPWVRNFFTTAAYYLVSPGKND
ncbi:MAG: class I SAM-dependent methyltransferase [Prolixibacteraceae bacterium]|nr:class I SAM-dependent methyltransferase [Prolixibacteraceae bacterium]MBN2773306.1 class I SAM-dependent methyltransferase [Prolixibacteraceae bacterium]